MTEQDLVEKLSDAEHASWARWMKYLFDVCDIQQDGDGYEHYVVPRELAIRWNRQIRTPYTDLDEREKQSDRDEVAHILPIIHEYAGAKIAASVSHTVEVMLNRKANHD